MVDDPVEAEEQERLSAWDNEPGSIKYWNEEAGKFDYPEGWPASHPQKPVSETWLGQQLKGRR